jgi:hypothetical protein
MPVRSLPLAAAAALIAAAAAAQTAPSGDTAAPPSGQATLGAGHRKPTQRDIEQQRSGDMATPAPPPAAIRSQTETDRLYQDIMRRSDPNR